MANFLSQEQRFNQPQNPINTQLIATVAGMKQDKYDRNLASTDQALDELGKYGNLLVRQEDKEYFANNVKNILDQVNSTEKMNFESSGFTRQIQGQIKSAIDDRIVKQIGESQKITAFQSMMVEKQKSKPELYSDINYNYALKKGGYQEYMSGASDSIGNLAYSDYINAPKVLDESIFKWAKDYGYHTEFSSDDPNQLIYKNSEHKVLSKDDILGKLKTFLDPNLQRQLQIDSDYHYTSQPEGQINVDAENYYKQQNAKIESQLVGIKAKRTSATDAQKIELDNNQKYYEGLKATNTEILKNKDFNNDSQKYQIYTSSLFNGIADNYEKDDIVDIKYVDSNLKIANFQSDIEYKKAQLDQGQQRIEIAKQQANAADLSNVIASGGTPGSITDIADKTAGEKTNAQIAIVKHNEDYKNLQSILGATDETYAGLNAKDKEEYIKKMATDNTPVSINNDSLTPEARQALETYKHSYNTTMKVKQEIVNTIGSNLRERYNDLLGGAANLGNLAKTAPTLANAVKSDKTLEQMSKSDRAAVLHEMAANKLNFDTDLSPEARETLKTYTTNLEQQKYLTPQQAKVLRDRSKDEIGMFSGVGDVLGGTLNALGEYIGRPIESAANLFRNNPNAQAETNAKYQKSGTEIANQMARGFGNMEKARLDRGAGLTEDSNITELEAGDLRKGAKSDFSTAIDGAITKATQYADKAYAKVAETAKDLHSVTFNSADKNQKPYVTALETQIRAISETPIEIAKGSVFETKLSPDGTSIDVTYTLKDAKEKTTTSIPTSSIPNLANTLKDKSAPWINSKYNKNAPARTMTFETPVDANAREELLYKLHTTYGEGTLPEKEAIAQNQPGGVVPTQVELRAYAQNQSPEIASQINAISVAPYNMIWMPNKLGSGFTGFLKDAQNNTVNLNGKQVAINLENKDYNEGAAKLAAVQLIGQFKKQLITQLIKN